MHPATRPPLGQPSDTSKSSTGRPRAGRARRPAPVRSRSVSEASPPVGVEGRGPAVVVLAQQGPPPRRSGSRRPPTGRCRGPSLQIAAGAVVLDSGAWPAPRRGQTPVSSAGRARRAVRRRPPTSSPSCRRRGVSLVAESSPYESRQTRRRGVGRRRRVLLTSRRPSARDRRLRPVGRRLVGPHAAILGLGPRVDGVSPSRHGGSGCGGRGSWPMAPPPDAPFLLACRSEPATAGAGVVHAPGRALAARVPAVRGRAASSTRSATPTWPPRSPCSRSAATASTPPSSTPTSSCRWPPSASASRSPRGRAGGRRAVPDAADLDRLRPLEPEADAPTCIETVQTLVGELGDVPLIGFAGAPFTVASYLVEGGRPHPRPHQGADARRPRPVGGLLDRLADMAVALAAGPGGGGRLGRPAVRLVGRDADARMYERHVLPASAKVFAGSPTSACPASTSGSAPASSSALMAEAGADGGRRRLAGRRSTRPAAASAPTWPSRATSTRRCAWRRGRRWPRPPARCWPQRRRARATSSTSATACCPRPTPTCSSGSSTSCTRRRLTGAATMTTGVVVMAYGTPAGRTTSRPTTPTSAGAGRRRPSSWPT